MQIPGKKVPEGDTELVFGDVKWRHCPRTPLFTLELPLFAFGAGALRGLLPWFLFLLLLNLWNSDAEEDFLKDCFPWKDNSLNKNPDFTRMTDR